jgi:hypothetical protein
VTWILSNVLVAGNARFRTSKESDLRIAVF